MHTVRADARGRCIVFFFSSRRRHTRSLCDWSSDVCSSDLLSTTPQEPRPGSALASTTFDPRGLKVGFHEVVGGLTAPRSEERRVGKECRSRWARGHEKKKEKRDKITKMIRITRKEISRRRT